MDISLILTNLRNITLNTNFINYENQHLCFSACSFIYKLYSYRESKKTRQNRTCFNNSSPVGGDMPDPSVVRVGDTYYMVHSSFIYTPGLVIYSSKNLADWTPCSAALPEYTGDIWAPDICVYGNRFLYLFSDPQ